MIAWTPLLFAALFPGYTQAFHIPRDAASGCSLSNAALVAPGYPPKFIALGVGTQNYTCNGTAFETAGAVAELYDISCLFGTSTFGVASHLVYGMWNGSTSTPKEVMTTFLGPNPLLLGEHMFVHSPAGEGILPKWDFTSSGHTAGNPHAYVIGVEIGDFSNLDPTVNVDNLMFKGIYGDLASQVFSLGSYGGQPPANVKCHPEASDITVKYTAQYWFFGGNVTEKND